MDIGGYAAVATRADEAMWRKSLASSELRKFTQSIELRMVVSTTKRNLINRVELSKKFSICCYSVKEHAQRHAAHRSSALPMPLALGAGKR